MQGNITKNKNNSANVAEQQTGNIVRTFFNTISFLYRQNIYVVFDTKHDCLRDAEESA